MVSHPLYVGGYPYTHDRLCRYLNLPEGDTLGISPEGGGLSYRSSVRRSLYLFERISQRVCETYLGILTVYAAAAIDIGRHYSAPSMDTFTSGYSVPYHETDKSVGA